MTPEELRRTMDFIVEHQARFATSIEQEREERLQQIQQEREERLQQIQHEREERLQQWKRDQPRIAQVEAAVLKLTELADIQSQRLDLQAQDFQSSLRILNRIMDRLPKQE